MPIVSGGGGAGGPAAGSYLPVADKTGVTVDSTTYADSIAGGGAKLTTLVFPDTGQGALAFALAGDAFPRLIFPSDPTDALLVMGDGTFNPYTSGSRVSLAYGNVHSLSVGGSVTATAAASTSGLATLGQVSPLFSTVSGALPTVSLVSGNGTQISTLRDVETHTSVTFNPGVATTATVTVALSPDNVTYSTLCVITKPVGTVFDGEIEDVVCRVPATWYLKLTVNAQALLGVTTYY